MVIAYQYNMSQSPFNQEWNLSGWSFPPQRCASPLSDDTTYTCPISDLSRQLSAHSLDARPTPREHTASPCQMDANSISPSTTFYEQDSPLELPNYLECTSANIRRQRQRTVREQCSASHLEAISALVARMIDNKDQCDVSSSSTGSVDEEDSPISPTTTRSSIDSFTSSVRTSCSSAPGRRSMENRIKKPGRPRSGAFSLNKTL